MSEEAKKILEMLKADKVSVEEAERLLKALGSAGKQKSEIADNKSGLKGTPRFLRILVDSADGDEVDIKLPLALVKSGLKISSIMPKGAEEKLRGKGIDLEKFAELNPQELIEALSELEISVESGDGDEISIFAE